MSQIAKDKGIKGKRQKDKRFFNKSIKRENKQPGFQATNSVLSSLYLRFTLVNNPACFPLSQPLCFKIKLIMGLILRRVISSSINGILVVFFLTVISLIIAFFFWFIPIRSEVSAIKYYVLFAFSYSVSGGLGLFLIPTLGSIIARIKLINIDSKKIKKTTVISRTLLLYFIPLFVFLIMKCPFLLFDIHDKQIMIMIFAPLLFISFFASLLIPISIVSSNGYRGVHDIVSGTMVVRKYENKFKLPDTRKIITKTIIISFISSIILMFAFLKIIFIFDIQKLFFQVASSKKENGAFFEIVEQIDSIMPNTPVDIRSYDLTGGVKWWVDLAPNTNNMVEFNKSIGLKNLNALDLIAYGVSAHTQYKKIELISIERDTERIIDKGEHVLNAHFFVGTGAFYFTEVKSIILSSFLQSLTHIADMHGIKIIDLKFIRMVKVGFVTIGFFDEVYFTNDGSKWRDKSSMYLPVILNFDSTITHKGRFISPKDLD